MDALKQKQFEKARKEAREVLEKEGFKSSHISVIIGTDGKIKPFHQGIKFSTMRQIYRNQGKGAVIKLLEFAKIAEEMEAKDAV